VAARSIWGITSLALALALAACGGADKTAEEAAKQAADIAASNDPKAIAASAAEIFSRIEPSQREHLDQEFTDAQGTIKRHWDRYAEKARQTYPNDPLALAELVDGIRTDQSRPQRSLAEAQTEIDRLSSTANVNEDEPENERARERMAKQRAKREAEQAQLLLSTKARLVNAKRIILLADQQIDLAAGRHPVVAEAVRRLRAKGPLAVTSSSDSAAVGNIVRQMQTDEPCFGVPAPAANANPGPFSSRGAAIGMTLPQAIGAVCAREKANIASSRVLAVGTFAERPPFISGAAPFWDMLQQRAQPAPGAQADFASAPLIREQLAQKYAGRAEICLGCREQDIARTGNPGSELRLGALPEGHVVAIERTQRFVQMIAANLQEDGMPRVRLQERPAPAAFKPLLDTLVKDLGVPSVQAAGPYRIVVAWVYPDRSKALPLENWAVGNGPTRLLSGKSVQASFCALAIPDMPLRNELSSAIGQRSSGAEHDAAGLSPNCGVVILAEFERDTNTSDVILNDKAYTLDTVVARSAKVKSYKLNIFDIDGIRARHAREQKAVSSRLTALDTQQAAVQADFSK